MNSCVFDRIRIVYVGTAVRKGWHLCRAKALLVRASYIAVWSSSKTSREWDFQLYVFVFKPS